MLAALAGVGFTTGCGSQDDTMPPVASVDFEPRLVVAVEEGVITVDAGPRPGAQATPDAEDADWTTPAGSVVEVRNSSAEPRRVVVTTGPSAGAVASEPASDEVPTVWLDTGSIEPGDSVVLGLSAVGDYTFAETSDDADPADGPTVRVAPRSTP
jgi:hypothetical protein